MTGSQKFYNLQGKVSHQGLPVKGVTLELFEDRGITNLSDQPPIERQTTGPAGEFCFAVKSGLYAISVIPDSSTRFAKQTVSKIAVTSNSNHVIILNTGHILNVAVADAAGSRLDNLKVTATGIDPYLSPITAHASSSGIYSLLLPRGKYRLVLETDTQKKGAGYLFRSSLQLDVFSDSTHEIPLPEMIQLRGSICDNQNNPVAGAALKVAASDRTDSSPFFFYCKDDGTFDINAEPGTYDIEIQPPLNAPLAGLFIKNKKVDGAGEAMELSLPSGRRLTGQVRFKEEALANCSVCVNSTDTKLQATRETNADGKFSFGLPAGNYRLRVIPSPHSRGLHPPYPSPWTRSVVLAGDTEVNVDIKEGSPLKVTLQSGRGEERPLVDVSIFADAGGPPSGDKLKQALWVKSTDIAGIATFNLAYGRYWLMVNHQPSTLSDFTMPDKEHEIRFAWTSGHIASFEVTDEKLNPVAEARISWEPYAPDDVKQTKLPVGAHGSESRSGDSFADAKGRCQLNLPAGIYSFCFQAEEGSPLQPRSIRQLSVGQDIHKKIKLTGKKTTERSNVQLQLIESTD